MNAFDPATTAPRPQQQQSVSAERSHASRSSQLGATQQPMPPHFGGQACAPQQTATCAAECDSDLDIDCICCRGLD